MDYIFSTLAYILEQLNAWLTRYVHEAFYQKCKTVDTWSGVQALRQGQYRRIVKIYLKLSNFLLDPHIYLSKLNAWLQCS